MLSKDVTHLATASSGQKKPTKVLHSDDKNENEGSNYLDGETKDSSGPQRITKS